MKKVILAFAALLSASFIMIGSESCSSSGNGDNGGKSGNGGKTAVHKLGGKGGNQQAQNSYDDSNDSYQQSGNGGSIGGNGQVVEIDANMFLSQIWDDAKEKYIYGKPAILMLSTTSCPNCRKMEPMLERIQSEYGNQLQVFHAQLDQDAQLNEYFSGIEYVPYLLYFNSSECTEESGYLDENQLRQYVEQCCFGNGNQGNGGNNGYDNGGGNNGYDNGGQVIYINDNNYQQQLNNCPVPCIIDFGAEWCQWCKKLEPVLDNLQRQYGSKIQVFRADVDESPNMSRQFGAETLPTMIFINSSGQQHKEEGYSPEEQLREMISQYCGVR